MDMQLVCLALTRIQCLWRQLYVKYKLLYAASDLVLISTAIPIKHNTALIKQEFFTETFVLLC
jgi:hypothetical protein